MCLGLVACGSASASTAQRAVTCCSELSYRSRSRAFHSLRFFTITSASRPSRSIPRARTITTVCFLQKLETCSDEAHTKRLEHVSISPHDSLKSRRWAAWLRAGQESAFSHRCHHQEAWTCPLRDRCHASRMIDAGRYRLSRRYG